MALNLRDNPLTAGQLPEALSSVSGSQVLKCNPSHLTSHSNSSRHEFYQKCSQARSKYVRPDKIRREDRSTRKAYSRRQLIRWLCEQAASQPNQRCCDECQLHHKTQAAFSPRIAQKQRVRSSKPVFKSLEIPYENFVGSFVGARFRLQYLRYQEDHLDIYSATSLTGQSLEAQAFSLSDLPAKLLQARKRRMKRLHQSDHFVDKIEQAGKRFFICSVQRSDTEWKNLTQKIDRHVSCDFGVENFPYLPGARCRRESFWSDSSDSTSVSSSHPPSSLGSVSSNSSYADVASLGLEFDNNSRTRKGIRQRQRRQRKRKEGSSGLV